MPGQRGKYKKFLCGAFPPFTKVIPLHKAVFLHYTHHIKMMCFVKGGKSIKNSKKNYHKSSLVVVFVQTCNLISICIGIYTVLVITNNYHVTF